MCTTMPMSFFGLPHMQGAQFQFWMDAQMSNYPPPPQPDQQHYTPLYPTAAGAQQLLDPVQQEQLNFSHLSSSIFPKLEADHLDPNAPNHIEQRIEQLQQQPPLPQQAQQQQQQQQQQHQQVHQQQQQQQQHQLPHHHHQQQQQPPPPPQPQHQHQHAHQHQQPPHQQAPIQHQIPPPLQHPPPQNQLEQPQKANRLRKACDSCSIRKVKCDESGPPCRACAALDIPCTFERPSRRRGPPNRHAEAIKRRRLESPHMSGQSTPSSPTHAAQALAALSSHQQGQQPPLSAELICDVQTLDLLVNDFFTYIHPLCPFPHEPSFREAWKRREDYNNKPFLALLASMIAALVASFPRKPRLHLKAQRKERTFPNHMALVQRCQKICADARGPGYLESESLSVHDAATSYFLGMTGCYTFRWRQCRLYFGECLTILRALGLHKPTEQHFTRLGSLPNSVGSHGPNFEGNREQTVDHITLEMGRRIFWTMFVSAKSIHQLGSVFSELVIPPETPTDPYPPLPAEVDDFCIFPHHIEQQPNGLLPMIAGFNANVRVYLSYNPLSTMEMAWGIDSVVDWERQKKVLHGSLQRCKAAVQELPHELVIWASSNNPYADHQNGNHDLGLSLTNFLTARDPATLDPNDVDATPEDRRRRQYEIQKANIHASSLCTRSYIVEKYFSLCEAQNRMKSQQQQPNSNPVSPGVMAAGLDGLLAQAATGAYDITEDGMADERENIVKDLLVVLSSIDRVNMEPNADSFTTKIRSVASTLLDVPKSRKGSVAQQAEQYLAAFLDILIKLERVSPANSDPDQPEDEDAELRHWADLREYQVKFAEQGGILGLG